MEKNITPLCDRQKETDQKMKQTNKEPQTKQNVATEVPVLMAVLFIQTKESSDH